MTDERGFTLIETVVTTAILLVVFVVTFRIIVALEVQQQNVSATVAGERQSELSSMAALQYIRSGYVFVSGSGTSLSVDSYIGTTPGVFSPNTGLVTVTFTPGSGSHEGALSTVVKGLTGPQSSSSLETADVLAPSGGSVFTYYAYATGSKPTLEQVTNPSTCPGDIVAIRIHMTFLGSPTAGAAPGAIASAATTIDTTVYLHNATGDTGVAGTAGISGNTGATNCV
jgi:prepilin-type N-terminal cleavage/methylation domain-containing protein